MNIDDAFAGRFIKGVLLKGKRWSVKIKACLPVEVYRSSERAFVDMWALSLISPKNGVPLERMLLLNKTNAYRIAEVLGSKETDDWIGEVIVLYPIQLTVGGVPRIGVRVDPVDNGPGDNGDPAEIDKDPDPDPVY